MTAYSTDAALRAALEQRLLDLSRSTHVNLTRLRRQVMVERLLSRLDAAAPGEWVLKGAVALEVRLGTVARATMDVDLGLRASQLSGRDQSGTLEWLTDQISSALVIPTNDPFHFRIVDIQHLSAAGTTGLARARLECRLAGRQFGRLQVDVAQRSEELMDTERLRLHGHLGFAGIEPPEIEVVSIARHVGEKFHGMLRVFEDRENTRVRDLADLVILREHGLIDPVRAAGAVRTVFAERATPVPEALPMLPAGWPDRYERLAHEQAIGAVRFPDAVAVIESLWREMFTPGGKAP